MSSIWSDEVLIPNANLIAYRHIYEAETWLRRICLAAFMLLEGPAWASTLDPRLREDLEALSAMNASLWYLGLDVEEELLWSTTQSQLAGLLARPALSSTVTQLCKVTGKVLSRRLRAVSYIRDALAHNRAISQETLDVLNGDLVVINSAIQVFKDSTLYAPSDIYTLSQADQPEDLLFVASEFTRLERKFSEQQLVLSANAEFVFLTRLPVEPFDVWPDAARLRRSLGLVSRLILCVLANKQGAELQVVFPRRLPEDDMLEVLNRFMTRDVLVTGWTETPPEAQHSADASWPRLWFYENRRQPSRR